MKRKAGKTANGHGGTSMRIPLIMRTLLLSALLSLPASAQFKAADKDGRIVVRDGDKVVFSYQHGPLKDPKGGAIFAASAFVHTLATPSGFQLNDMQPGDHLHHLGVWWPWKLVGVDGGEFVTWEMQKKQGRHRAVDAKLVSADDDKVLITGNNVTEVSKDGEKYTPVIDGTASLVFSRHGKDGYQLDIDLHHTPVEGKEVDILKYRYSGFCWRGTPEWTAETSTLLTSGGHHRDNGNHQPATWCMVYGKTPTGKATMLILSAAEKPELLRVWGSKDHHGIPFVNFNPVVKESLRLTEDNKAVSRRSYRLIMVDRELNAGEADHYWAEWTTSLK